MYPGINPTFPFGFGLGGGFNQPYSAPGAAPQQLVKVSGLDGAKAYQMPPNSSVALFHESENLLYVKTTDGAGFPTVRTFKFEEISGEAASGSAPAPDYVSREEFEAFKKEVANAQQPF